MKNIDNFYLEKGYKRFYLKVLFKNKKSENIYCFKNMTEEDLEGLIYLLNEKLININNINHIDNDVTP